LVVGFGSLDQAVKLDTGRRLFGGVAEQPVLSSDDEGADRAFGSIVVDQQIAFLDIPLQLAPVTCQVADGFAQSILTCGLGLCLFDPALQLGKYRHAVFITTDLALRSAASFEVALETVKFVDQVQRDMSTPCLVFGLHLLSFDELTTCMSPIPQTLNTGLRAQTL
jgi:hypothetical protein